MFTDLVGFTEFTALRGDDAALALLAVQDRLVTAALPGGARIVKELGDGLLLYFPDPASALRTGLTLQEAFEGRPPPPACRSGSGWGCTPATPSSAGSTSSATT